VKIFDFQEVRGRLTQCATARPHARQCRKNQPAVNGANRNRIGKSEASY
jgi:hypothetical protein